MPSNRHQGARAGYYGTPGYRDRSGGREPPKSYKPAANPSAMLGTEFVTRLADLHMSINEFCRMSGIAGGTGTNYSKADRIGRIPAWVDIVLRYAKIDAWFGRRFKEDAPGYVALRGTDRDRWSALMDQLERLADALIREDIDEALKACMSVSSRGWAFRNHLLEVKEKLAAQSPEAEPQP